MKPTPHRSLIVAVYGSALLALLIGLIGQGAVWSALTANILLLVMLLCAVAGIVYIWHPARSRTVNRRLFATLVAILPVGFFLAILLAVAFRR